MVHAQAMKLDAKASLFTILVSVFVTCLIVGDLIGGKLTSVHLFGREWIFSVGQLAFPVTFILTDILNEFYGKRVARKVTYLALAMVALTFGIIFVAGQLPWWSVAAGPTWDGVGPVHFNTVFTQASRIQLSSMVAFLIANLVDIWVFFLLRRLTRERFLWLRATGSTAVSQLLDTAVIVALAFGEKLTAPQYLTTVGTSYVIKVLAAVLITPLIYALHEVLERRAGFAPAANDA